MSSRLKYLVKFGLITFIVVALIIDVALAVLDITGREVLMHKLEVWYRHIFE
jgi:hypothetical protein